MLRRGLRLQNFLLLAVLVNLMVLVYLAFLQDRLHLSKLGAGAQADSLGKQQGKNCSQSLSGNLDNGITVIFREFEDFENDLGRTVSKFMEYFAKSPILVVADSMPYPPLSLPKSPLVRVISNQVFPEQSVSYSRPDMYIHTKYVLLSPDSVQPVFGLDFPQYTIQYLEHQRKGAVKIVAWPVDSDTNLHCSGLNVSIKEWTLTHLNSPDPRGHFCDSLEGQYVLLLRTEDFLQLSSPFDRPLATAFFTQTAVRGWKIAVDDKILFQSKLQLYQNPHNSWKYKKKTRERQKLFYKSFGIKRVQLADGQEEWYGCSKESSRCFGSIVNSVPDYLHLNRCTPPCCLRALRTTARHVFRILDAAGVRYWLEGGSLLGAARLQDIIPWDYDVDIGIYKEDMKKSYHLLSALAEPFVDDEEFLWEKAPDGGHIVVQYSSANHMHVDIFPFYSRNGTMTKDLWMKDHRQDTEFPEHFLKPLTRIAFAGLQAPAPNNIVEFLELKFGKGVIENPSNPGCRTNLSYTTL